MKPRIFVSSTFYDLKHVREDLSSFIKQYSFEPIMFEDGDIGYIPNKALDQSCYDTMNNTDMVILIIGGQYGSAATGENDNDKFSEYLSVTRKEFQTAYVRGLPIYVFIDSTVYAEYEVYSINLESIEKKKIDIKFSATKSINVFRFIKEIKAIGNIAITAFDKSSKIKDFLAKQWADMFKLHLQDLRNQKQVRQLQDTIDDTKKYIEKMNIMIDGIGKKLLDTNDNGQYLKILEEQTKVDITNLCDAISNNILIFSTQEQNKTKCINDVVSSLAEAYASRDRDSDFLSSMEGKGYELFACDADLILSNDIWDKLLSDTKLLELLKNELISDKFYNELFGL